MDFLLPFSYEDLHLEQQLISPLDPISSMVVINESPVFAKDDLVVFPPINHENLQVASSIYVPDRYLESPSESSSPSSSSRRSASSSSFSLFPSDLDGQSPLTRCELEQKSPRSPSGKGGKSPSPPLYRETEVWWELLLVRVYSKLKRLVTWFSATLRSFYPVLAIAIWWWMRVRARRRRINGETTNHLRDAIKERDERILKLLHQIAQMNELLVKQHKDVLSRR